MFNKDGFLKILPFTSIARPIAKYEFTILNISLRDNSGSKTIQKESPSYKITRRILLENLLEIKLEHMEIRHKTQISVFGSIGGSAGAMGMIGTLVGLVAMLANLSDPSAVGPAMAVALLTTMYGALIGTGFAGIFESKLEQKHAKEMIASQIIIQGAHMIASEESIGNVKMKLGAIMPSVEE